MLDFEHIKTLEKHRGSVWSINWSNSGGFISSCGTDGKIILWGPLSIEIFFKKKKKNAFEKNFFSSWGAICFFKKYNEFKTLRELNFFFDTNEICIGGFSGICFLCKTEFKKQKKFSYLEIKEKLIGILPEIKSCCFSFDGAFISASGRDRTIWIWEKNLYEEHQCLFVITGLESDIKQLEWHPRWDVLFSSTYKGIIRGFNIKKEAFFNFFSFKLTKASIWALDFTEDGKEFYVSTGEGNIVNLPSSVCFIPLSKKSKIKNDSIFFWSKKGDFSGLSLSKISGVISGCGENGDLDFFKKKKIWAKKKIKKINIGKTDSKSWLNFEASLVRLHLGNSNSIIWHPKNESIIASCGEDSGIQIWSLTFFEIKKFKKKQTDQSVK